MFRVSAWGSNWIEVVRFGDKGFVCAGFRGPRAWWFRIKRLAELFFCIRALGAAFFRGLRTKRAKVRLRL